MRSSRTKYLCLQFATSGCVTQDNMCMSGTRTGLYIIFLAEFLVCHHDLPNYTYQLWDGMTKI